VRQLLERLSRNRVVARRLPREFGSLRLYVSPDSALRFWRRRLGAEERALLAWAGELVAPGASVWDVGANVGVFSFAAAWLAGRQGRVLALEPDPFLAGLLRRTARGAPPQLAVVDVEEAAACDRAGRVRLHVAVRGRASNHIEGTGRSTAGGAREVREVAAVTLDGLLAGRRAPDLVKIDVEGAEAAVLRGAGELLRRARPRLLCEVSTELQGAVSAELAAHGYRLFDAEQPPSRRRPLERAAWNTLAVPGAP
jgi:FkbM family methyltransferase